MTRLSLTGGCLCGAVRYSYEGPLGGALGAITVCHCSQCRRAQGYASAVAPADAAGFSLTTGEAAMREFESSPGKLRVFCGVCGAPIYSRRVGLPGVLRLRIGSLDVAPPDLRVDAHIYTAGLPGWAAPDGAAPHYPGPEPAR